MNAKGRQRKVPAKDDLVQPGAIVQSKAGHDKYRLFLVMGTDTDRVWLADGLYRPVEHQKQKNTRHVRAIVPAAQPDLLSRLKTMGDTGQQNAFLKKALAAYTDHQACRQQKARSRGKQNATEQNEMKEES